MKNESNSLKLIIDKDGQTVKEILKERYEFSSRLCSKIKRNRSAYLNGQVVKLSKSTFAGDELTIYFDDDKIDEYTPVKMDLHIIYEDNCLLIVDKPPFMVVHPSKSHFDDSLANGIRYYFDSNNIDNKIRLVNRLDMNTSGLVIIAKNSYTHNNISNQMSLGSVDKYYKALVEGSTETKGSIDAPIGRLHEDDLQRVVHENGKHCLTHYWKEKQLDISEDEKLSLMLIKLETGRTHQIRVHMKHIGHPLLADDLYNKTSPLINRQALHCYKMSFDHPLTKKRITVTAELPADFNHILNREF